MIEWFFGFHRPWLSPTGIFGHCEAWGYTQDDTWLFIDPRSRGSIVTVTHHHDDVLAALAIRHTQCATILKLPATQEGFRFPLHGPLTCASLCGHLVGIRALLPRTLERKLRAKGAEVVHGYAERKC